MEVTPNEVMGLAVFGVRRYQFYLLNPSGVSPKEKAEFDMLWAWDDWKEGVRWPDKAEKAQGDSGTRPSTR